MDVSSNKAVLVTGGRGFVGRAVVNLLKSTGCSVISLDQSGISLNGCTKSDLSTDDYTADEVECDISDSKRLLAMFEERKIEEVQIAGIIHLAAILPTAAQRDPTRATRVNVEGSFHLLEMARQFGIRRFVFASSLSAYGTFPAEKVISETDRSAPEDLYGAAKLYIEQLGALYRQHYGLEFVSLRIGRVLGPGAQSATSAWRSEIFELLSTNRASAIVLPYESSERILVSHVDDVARMLATLLHASQTVHAIYNAPCESVVVNDLKRAIETLNSNVRIELGSGPAVGNPRRLDCSRFQREFGFSVVSIFEQLKAAAKN